MIFFFFHTSKSYSQNPALNPKAYAFSTTLRSGDLKVISLNNELEIRMLSILFIRYTDIDSYHARNVLCPQIRTSLCL